VLNAGVAEKVENLTMQLIEKIGTPAITMDTASLMDESREIEMKLDSNEYLEEFRVSLHLTILKIKENFHCLGIEND